MSMDKIKGILRHILTFVGGLMVAQGMFDEETLTAIISNIESLIGIATFLFGTFMSIISKDKPSNNPSGAG